MVGVLIRHFDVATSEAAFDRSDLVRMDGRFLFVGHLVATSEAAFGRSDVDAI